MIVVDVVVEIKDVVRSTVLRHAPGTRKAQALEVRQRSSPTLGCDAQLTCSWHSTSSGMGASMRDAEDATADDLGTEDRAASGPWQTYPGELDRGTLDSLLLTLQAISPAMVQ